MKKKKKQLWKNKITNYISLFRADIIKYSIQNMNIHYCFGFVCCTRIPHMLTSCPPPTPTFLSHQSMRKKGVEKKEKERKEWKGKRKHEN